MEGVVNLVCKICEMTDTLKRETIEAQLQASNGVLTKEQLEEHEGLTSKMCLTHFNFHQSSASIDKKGSKEISLAADVGKDEADVLFQLLNEQAATFTGLNNKVNEAITEHDGDLTTMFINPCTAAFYKDLGESIRANVRELRELNISLNGKKDGALEGLKALAMALQPDAVVVANKDMSTTEYDDD